MRLAYHTPATAKWVHCHRREIASNPDMSSAEQLNDAHALDPADPRFRPVELHLDKKSGLRIRWADGVEQFFPIVLLRKNCPCATCRAEREESEKKPAGPSLTILPKGIERATEVADASLVGNYAINIVWGDGHSTGIYDFRYLRSIGSLAT